MKSVVLLALVCSLAIVQLVLARHSNLNEWIQYKQKHGKVYETPEEDAKRFAMFLSAKDKIEQHNSKQSVSYKLGLNHLSDWTSDELAKLTTGLRYNATEHKLRSESPESRAFLQSLLARPQPPVGTVDWRQKNRVTAVKDMGKGCYSSFAFAVTGALEGQEAVVNPSGTLTPLSEQDILDCSKFNSGCDGGQLDYAFIDIGKQGGIMSEQDYPYEAKNGTCRFDKKKAVITDSGAIALPVEDGEPELRRVVTSFGPVAIGIHAMDDLASYESGVYGSLDCNGPLNLAVLVVGYGSDKNTNYWIVKNSWGPNWGEGGYFRIIRGLNVCGIGSLAVIPDTPSVAN